ncbi:V-type H+-transporting ATPase 16kDa proteolipid subunit [Nematocida displodere]|uniref:V-type H+-transporting ATPase 16kDa proteolipid subunit n=1 Tax=Nematocida displodere TaxID=1805483 RepID=A0A177EH50_9MICR|nr:V-type H+-transporting ATPase 16kDa proteolipid subunit [Nematocida displodere]
MSAAQQASDILQNKETLPFIISISSLTAMVVLSAIGATVGSVKASASAAMVAGRHADIMTKAYLPVLLASACFIYAMILVIISITHISYDMKLQKACNVMAATLIYGSTAMFVGIAIGSANKTGLVRLSENRGMFLSFLILNSSLELPAIFAMICSIWMLS